MAEPSSKYILLSIDQSWKICKQLSIIVDKISSGLIFRKNLRKLYEI